MIKKVFIIFFIYFAFYQESLQSSQCKKEINRIIEDYFVKNVGEGWGAPVEVNLYEGDKIT